MATRSTTAAANGGILAAAAGSPSSALRRGRGHKERSKNFTELEKRTVLELIARHRDVLKQGRSNNATNKSKQLVWSTICEQVNYRCGGDRPRTPAQVKMWYENYKKKCKMRATEPQPTTTLQENTSLLDGMLWQNIHPLQVKEDESEAMENGSITSIKEEDLPVNMSNGRGSSVGSSEELPSMLEPQVTIVSHSPPQPKHLPMQSHHKHVVAPLLDYRRLHADSPLNLSHLEHQSDRHAPDDAPRHRRNDNRDDTGATEEERLYYTARRQHAIWEHEAKMRILNMELRQKEEIFSLQKQLFLIELKLKMDFLEKACSK